MEQYFLEIIFAAALLLILWTYLGYPLLLAVINLFMPQNKQTADDKSMFNVSLIVTAYNEEANIAEKLNNCLELDYPEDKLEIIVVSDGSTDSTNRIIEEFDSFRIHKEILSQNMGKHFAQQRGIQLASHDILVFTDAATLLEKDAISKIVQDFSDPRVGCISGMDKTNDESEGEGVYVKYEMMLRRLESSFSSLLGVSGSFFAVRKDICCNWYNHLTSDFFVPIEAYQLGYRIKLDEKAIGKYKLSQKSHQEFFRKVRTIVHGLNVLFHYKYLLNPFKYKFYAFQMFSHKLLRWLVPFNMLVIAFVSTLLFNYNMFFKFFFFAQILFYSAAILPVLSKKFGHFSLFKIPFFLLMVHVAMLVAWWQFLGGEKYTSWQSTERQIVNS